MSLVFGWLLYGIVAGAILHRGLSHKCYIFRNKIIEYIICLLIVISGQGSPIGWVAIHRLHHSKTDRIGDPQSPHVVGKFKTLLSWYDISSVKLHLVKDLLKIPSVFFIHRHYGKLFIVYTITLAAIDPIIMLYFSGMSVTICALIVGIFNTIAHGSIKNSAGHYACNLPMDLFFFGEANHLKHHINPKLIRLNKIDFCYMIIKILAKPNSL